MMNFQAASFNQRLLAQSVDLTILFPGLLILDLYWSRQPLLFWLLCALGYHVYAIVFENSRWRGTPGKKILQLEIIGLEGGELSLGKILIRHLLKWLSLALLFAGFFMIYFHPKKQSLHDFMTGTLVVSKINSKGNW